MSLQGSLGFEERSAKRASPVGLRWAHSPELSFPFPGSGVLKPDLYHAFLQTHLMRNVIDLMQGMRGDTSSFCLQN